MKHTSSAIDIYITGRCVQAEAVSSIPSGWNIFVAHPISSNIYNDGSVSKVYSCGISEFVGELQEDVTITKGKVQLVCMPFYEISTGI